MLSMIVRAAELPQPSADFIPPFSRERFSTEEHYLDASKAAAVGLLADLREADRRSDFAAPASRGECAQLLHELMLYREPGCFVLHVLPLTLARDSIPGQRVVFLVTVSDRAGQQADPVTVSAVTA